MSPPSRIHSDIWMTIHEIRQFKKRQYFKSVFKNNRSTDKAFLYKFCMCDWPEPNFFSHRRAKHPAGDGKYSQKPVSMTSAEEPE